MMSVNFNGNNGHLIVIVGPSGAGKTTLVKALLSAMPNLKLSISHTTRAMRPGENDGVNYYFTSEANFKQLIVRQEFLEYAKVYDYFYGTLKAWVQAELNKGSDIILELDWQGAQQIKAMFADKSIFIYILPPSLEVLHQRLKNRAQDQPEIIVKRLAKAKDDISHYHEFDYLVVNGNLEKAVFELQAIITSMHLRINNQKTSLDRLLKQLLY